MWSALALGSNEQWTKLLIYSVYYIGNPNSNFLKIAKCGLDV